MPLLGHWPELFVVLLIGLLVFGPKRMIEMGSTLGKAVREMRESLKDIPGIGGSGLQSLLGQDEPRSTPFVSTTQTSPTTVVAPRSNLTEDPAEARTDASPPIASREPAAGEHVVEGSVEQVIDRPED
jgi:sec-independent protein translocase protein TatA